MIKCNIFFKIFLITAINTKASLDVVYEEIMRSQVWELYFKNKDAVSEFVRITPSMRCSFVAAMLPLTLSATASTVPSVLLASYTQVFARVGNYARSGFAQAFDGVYAIEMEPIHMADDSEKFWERVCTNFAKKEENTVFLQNWATKAYTYTEEDMAMILQNSAQIKLCAIRQLIRVMNHEMSRLNSQPKKAQDKLRNFWAQLVKDEAKEKQAALEVKTEPVSGQSVLERLMQRAAAYRKESAEKKQKKATPNRGREPFDEPSDFSDQGKSPADDPFAV